MNTRVDTSAVKANTSFHDLEIAQNNGNVFKMDTLKNKKVMLVNTASDCGYTTQYDNLQKLSETYNDKLMIIGFPSNDFGEQEKADDGTIQEFCKINFGVTFPLMAKSTVRKKSHKMKFLNGSVIKIKMVGTIWRQPGTSANTWSMKRGT